jgi:hypothetical protein
LGAAKGEWELVDGQQRLTTLYLVFLYMERERLQNASPPYAVRYETRPRSEAFLRDLNGDPGENVDFFHIDAAYRAIAQWFDAHGARRQYAANKVYEDGWRGRYGPHPGGHSPRRAEKR